jgi:hypothetical protein
MALILLFLLSSVFLFLDAGPFTVAGIFLIICYIPGLSLLALARKDKLLFEDLVLAFPCSIGISGLLTIWMLVFGIAVKYVPVLIHLLSGAVIAGCLIVKKNNRPCTAIHMSRNELWFGFFALLTTLILSIPFVLGPDRITIANHVFHHSSIITQIINGIFPPENPGLGGTTIGYYWGFHSLIAAISVKTGYQQIQIVFVLNALSLYMVFCIAYAFAKAFDLSELYCYMLPLAVIGLMRFDAGILFLYKLFSGNLISADKIDVPLLHPSDLLRAWFNGISWLDTRLLFVRKFYNVSGMPLAVSLCFAYLLLLRLLFKKKGYENHIYKIILVIVIVACFLNYPPLAIFVLLHAPLWSIYMFLSEHGNVRQRALEGLKTAVPYIIAMLIVTPYILFVIKSRGVSSSGQGSLFSLDFYAQSLKNMVVFLVPLPVIVFGAWVAFKKMSWGRDYLFLIISTALCLGLTIFTRWPFDNSYKFNYIQTFFFAIFFVFALSGLLPLLAGTWSKRIAAASLVVLLLLLPAIIMTSYISAALHTKFRYNFSGKHFIYEQDMQKNEAYEWIRRNTPVEALIMLSYMETPWPCCGLNNNYEVAAITERNLYVIKDTDYTTSNPEYAKRVAFREKVFETPEDPEVHKFFDSLHRPVYLLVEDNLSDRFLVEQRFENFPKNPGKPFVLLFDNGRQRVYLVQTETS